MGSAHRWLTAVMFVARCWPNEWMLWWSVWTQWACHTLQVESSPACQPLAAYTTRWGVETGCGTSWADY